MEALSALINLLVPLVIIMDPLGNLPFFLAFTRHNTPDERRRMAAIAAGAACLILAFFVLTGEAVLKFFAISLPAFQIAGGVIFFIYSLEMLGLISPGIRTSDEEEEEGMTKENVALVPLAIPMLAGPGAITAVLVWQQNPPQPIGLPLIFAAIVLACLAAYLVFRFGTIIGKALGVGGIRVITRLMGLLVAVIAVEFMVSGFKQIIG